MKATIIAVDFIKDTDGSFKALEMNTGVGFHPLTASAYTDITPITSFVSSNNITEVDYIGSHGLGNMATSPLTLRDLEAGDYDKNTNFGPRSLGIVNSYFSSSVDHTFTLHGTQTGATSVPYIEDSNDKLIIRNAFDSTALVDTQYATTAIGFLDFIKEYCTGSNAVEVPKSFIAPWGTDGTEPYSNLLANDPQYDTIDVNNVRDNGTGIPNYIVKLNSSTVESDYQNFPKVYHVTSSDELDDLKKSLSAEFILQEYIYNPEDLVEGKAKTYRIISAIAGPTLESLHFFHPYFVSNHLPIPASTDYRDDHSVQPWDRPAFTQKISSLADSSFGQNVLGSDFIVGADNSDLDPDSLTENYSIRSLAISGLDPNEENYSAQTWTGSFTGTTPGELDFSSIVTHDTINTTFIGLEIGLDDESTLSLTPSAEILGVSADEQNTKFFHAEILEPGDKIIKINHVDPSQPAEVLTVTSVNTKVRVEQAIRMDVESTDTFLVKTGVNTSFVLHNGTYSSCACVYCGGYSYGSSNCINNSCFAYPGCYVGSMYCTGYETSTSYGCLQNKE
jgi:hypothetical protein